MSTDRRNISIKILSTVIALQVFLGLNSCDEVLEIEAEGAISGDVFNNRENIEKALTGAYYSFGGINDGSVGGELMGGDFTLIPTLLARQNNSEISWDDVNGAPYSNFMDKTILATNTRVEANWRRAYEVINTLNNILANIDNVSDANAKSKIQGEALAMRGILYFEMVRLWGEQYRDASLDTEAIPIQTLPITQVDEIKTPTLATVEEVYAQAETDLLEGGTLLQGLGKNGTNLSYYTCQAYLMRLNLQKKDYVAAQGFANAILSSNEFTLTATPVEAFNNLANSTEDIFAVQQTTTNNAGDRSTGSGLPNYYSSVTQSGLGVMRIFEFALVSSARANGPRFSAIDLRGNIDTGVDATTLPDDISTLFYTNILNTSLLSSSKYLKADRVIPKIRLAEIHLSRAEAIYEQNIKVIDPTALSDLNTIRNRAGLPTLVEGDFITSFAFYDSLVLERKRELLYEGIIFHDLKRWEGKVGSTPALSSRLILPIPQSETDTWTD